MKFMIRMILVFTICYFFCLESFCQDNTLTISVRVESDNDKSNSLSQINNFISNQRINELIENGIIISIRQSFPYSKYDMLLNLVTIVCNRRDSLTLINELNGLASVKEIMVLNNVIPSYSPSDWYYAENPEECWHLDHIQANLAWDITKGSQDVTIAILDTDFDYAHPDLHSKFILNYDPYTLSAHQPIPVSQETHGTAVASVAIAETDGGGRLASVGFNTMFYAYRSTPNSLESAHHASFALGVDVISCSFHSQCIADPVAMIAIQEIIDNGTIVVASAGNGPTHCSGGETCPWCSLNDDRIIIVSTTGRDDRHYIEGTTDSHYPGVDLCAPGEDIPVATGSIGTSFPYYGFSGQTSIATPMVAATCALMRSVNPCLSPEQTEDVLKNTADPILDEHLYPGLVGAGRLNVYQAVLGAIEEVTLHYDNMTLTGTHTYSSGMYLSSANSTVKNGAHITFQAGKDITLDSNFTVELGGEFTAESITAYCP